MVKPKILAQRGVGLVERRFGRKGFAPLKKVVSLPQQTFMASRRLRQQGCQNRVGPVGSGPLGPGH